MTVNQTWTTFYRRLAYLYYAVAKADEKVVPEEIAKLREVVKKDWLSLETTEDAFGTDAAYQIEIAFDWLLEQSPAAEKALEKFENFINDHPDFLDARLKKRILRTSNAIAEAYHGKNEDEVQMLEKIRQMLA